jgi:transcriptional regulator with XRE-family HTH domain
MINQMNAEEWEMELGKQLRSARLRQNIDQRQLAGQAGIALNAVKNMEAGKGATITSLIKVLRALGRTDWLNLLAPAVSISPLQALKARPTRQRVSKRKSG